MEITKNNVDAMGDIIEMITPWTKKEEQNQTIAILAILAGSFLLRSFPFNLIDFRAGEVLNMHSENEQAKEKELEVIMRSSLELFGIHVDYMGLITNNQTIDEQINFLEVVNRFQGPALQIMKNRNLTYEQMAHSCAMATTYFIKNGNIDLGYKTAFYYFMIGSRTCPPDFN